MMFQLKMLRLAKGAGPMSILCVALGMSLAAVSIWRGLISAQIISDVFSGRSFLSIFNSFMHVLCLALAAAVISWLRRGADLWVAARVKQHLRTRLLTKLAQLGPGYVNQHQSGKIQAVLVDGVEALEGYFGSYVPQVLITLTVPTAILIYILTLDLYVGLVLAGAVALAMFGPKLWDRLLGDYGQAHWHAYASLNSEFVDSMQGMTTLVSFNAAERRGSELKLRAAALYQATMRQLAVSLMSGGVVSLAVKGGSAAALAVAAVRTAQGQLPQESLLIILFLAAECIGPLADLDRAWHAGYMGVSASSGIFDILEAVPRIAPTAQYPIQTAQRPEIVFENVSFAYDDRPAKVLDQVNLTLAAGQTTAVVGASGAGKSTLAALLMRFIEGSGQIRLDGVPLDKIPLDDLHQNIAVVSQDTYLFYGSVADNLRLAKPEATTEELERAAREAGAHHFIQRLPEGYQTVIGERGQKLSGGEKQRLAIARALLKDAPILILDEATANVDSTNEAHIQQALHQAGRSRTTLVIAHRLNTVQDADRIYVLDHGRITEEGRHRDLLGLGGVYARLATGEVA